MNDRVKVEWDDGKIYKGTVEAVIFKKGKDPLYRIHFDDGSYAFIEEKVISSITSRTKSTKKEHESDEMPLSPKPKQRVEKSPRPEDTNKEMSTEAEDRHPGGTKLPWKDMWQIFRAIMDAKDDKYDINVAFFLDFVYGQILFSFKRAVSIITFQEASFGKNVSGLLCSY